MKNYVNVFTPLTRCPVLPVIPIENFFGSLLEEELKNLSRMPGTPGTVMTAQFVYYMKQSQPYIAEIYRRKKESSKMLLDMIWRMRSLEEVEKEAKRVGSSSTPNKNTGVAAA